MKKINRKGFTLIEVIMTVAILGLITLIIVPSIGGLIEKNKDDSYENLKKSFIAAAKTYVADNRYSLGISCPTSRSEPTKCITLQTLVAVGNLTGTIVDPRTEEEINLEDNGVKVKYSCSKKTFSYEYFEKKSCS